MAKSFMRSSVFQWKLFCLFFIFLGLSNSSRASTVLGGNITYTHVDSLIYDVDLTIYRDCRGVSFKSSMLVYVACGSETPVSVSLNRIAISDITPVCSSATKPCSPSNTYSTGKGIEKHVYRKRIDLSNSVYNDITACGKVRFEFSNCCRSATITTGASSSKTYIYAMIDLSKASDNSSPKFENEPLLYVPLNTAVEHRFKVRDRKDNDSFSFHLTYPLQSHNNYVKYSGIFSPAKPYTVYDPFNNGSVYPNTNPPIGYYFDTIGGRQVFTPTIRHEGTVIVIEVIEWRKDSAGTPQKIGVTMLEYLSVVEPDPGNFPPEVVSPTSYNVCKGDSITIDIKTLDKTFVPPPPDTIAPDTVRVSWEYKDSSNIFGNLSILDTSKLNPTVRFTWRAKEGAEKQNAFILLLNDDHCRWPGVSEETIIINVVDPPVQIYSVSDLRCGKLALKDNTLNSGRTWDILDINGIPVKDTALVFMSRSKSYTSPYNKDTVTFSKQGKYIVRIKSQSQAACYEYGYDTVDVKLSSYDLFSNADSLLCDDWNLRLFPDGIDTTVAADYRWSTSPLDTLPSISVERDSNDQVIALTVTTSDGCVHDDEITLLNKEKPSIRLIPDSTVCNPFNLVYNANDLVNTGKLITAVLWENEDTSRVREITSAAAYYLSANNYCGSDTSFFFIEAFDVPELEPISSFVECVPLDSILSINDLKGPENGPYTYRWSTKDTTRQLNINEPGTYGYSIENICGSDSSSVTVHILNAPDVNLGPDTLILSQLPDFEIVADTVEGDYLWSTGDTTRSLHITSAGTYWVTVVNKCGSSSDTTTIQLLSVADLMIDNLKIIPNPTEGVFRITGEDLNDAIVSMTDITGRIISVDQKVINGEIHLILSDPEPGIYFATIRTEKGTATLKVLVKI